MNKLKLMFQAMAIMGLFIALWMPLSAHAQPPSDGAVDSDVQPTTFDVEISDGQIITLETTDLDDLRLRFDDTRFTRRVLKGLRREALQNCRTTKKVINKRRRRIFIGGDIITAPPPGEPIAAIFECGGDFEQSDGTCNDVIVACATIGIDFECNKEDEEGVCTNGGC